MKQVTTHSKIYKRLQWGIKVQVIQADFGTFTHILICSGIIQAYSVPCGTLAYTEPETYGEPWNIWNQRYIQNPVKYLRWNILWKLWTAKIVFTKSAFHVLYFFKIKVYFLLKKYLLFVKKTVAQGAGGCEFWYIHTIFKNNMNKKQRGFKQYVLLPFFL